MATLLLIDNNSCYQLPEEYNLELRSSPFHYCGIVYTLTDKVRLSCYPQRVDMSGSDNFFNTFGNEGQVRNWAKAAKFFIRQSLFLKKWMQ